MKKHILASVLAVAGFLAVGFPAQAGLTTKFQEFNSSDVEVYSDTIVSGNPNVLSHLFTGPGWNVVISSTVTNSPGGAKATLDFNLTGTHNSKVGNYIVITTWDDAFTSPPAGPSVASTSNSNSSSSSVASFTFENKLDAVTLDTGTLPKGGSSGISNTPVTILGSPFELRSISTIKLPSVSSSNNGFTVQSSITIGAVVPEPASIVAWGLGMACFGAFAAVRRRKA